MHVPTGMSQSWYQMLLAFTHTHTHTLQGEAKGQLYIDDGHSYNYKNGEYLLRQFAFSNNKLTSSSADSAGSYSTKSWLERVIVVGLPRAPASVSLESGMSIGIVM